MARSAPYLAALNAGEFSPKIRGRTDFSRYPAGAETLLNLLIDERGGIFRRPGTVFVKEVKASANETFLVDREPDSDAGYVLEMGASYFRFFKNQARIDVVSTSTAISNGAFGTDLTDWADVDTGTGASAHSASHGGSMSLNGGGTGATDIAGREQTVSVGAGDTAKVHVLLFQVIGDYGPIGFTAIGGTTAQDGVGGEWATLRIGTSSGGEQVLADTHYGRGYHAVEFTPGATTIYIRFQHRFRNKAIFIDNVSIHAAGALELTHHFIQADLEAVRWAGSSDFCWFVHGDYHPYILKRRGDRSWSFEQAPFLDGPYLDENVDSTLTLTAATATGFAVNLTASRALWKTTDVGRVVAINDPTNTGWGIIVGYTSTTVVTIDVLSTMTTGAQTEWQLGAWGSARGYPKQVDFFQQRSVYAATEEQPATVWMSKTADIHNFASLTDNNSGSGSVSSPAWSVFDDNAVTYTLVEQQTNAIVGLGHARDLVIFTSGSETPATTAGASITPTDVNATPQSTYGSNGVRPHAINSVAVFVQKGGRRLLRMGFDVRIEGYAAEDLTILSDHITRSGIRWIGHQQEPVSVIWCLLNNGTLASMTFHPEQQVAGWSRQAIGGKFGGRKAVVEAMSIIAGNADASSGERDEIWMIVKRTINGGTKRYVEVLGKDWELGDALETTVYVDSAVTDNNWNTDTTKTLTLGPGIDVDDDDLWEQGDSLTLEADGHTPFLSGDVGDVWRLRYEGVLIDVEITAFTDTDTVTVELRSDVPAEFRDVTIDEWLDPGSKVSSMSGLDHLEGESVIALCDGALQGPFTVSSGAITLDDSAGCIVAGLKYEHRYKSLKLDAGATLGTAVGKKKVIGDITLEFYASPQIRIGPSFTNADMEAIETRENTDPVGMPDKLWSGEYHVTSKDWWDEDVRICIKGDIPLPFFMLAIAPEMETNEVL